MNRTTIISIMASSIIIGLSLGITTYLNPIRENSLINLKNSIINNQQMKESGKYNI